MSSVNFKTTSMDRKMNTRYSQVRMVSVCPILTAVSGPSWGSVIYFYFGKDYIIHWLTCRAEATDLVLCYRFPLLFLVTLGMSFPMLEFFFQYHRWQDFSFRQVSFAGIFLGIVTPPPLFSNGLPLKGLIAVDICNFSKLFLLSCILCMSRPSGIIGTTLLFAMSFMNWLIEVWSVVSLPTFRVYQSNS